MAALTAAVASTEAGEPVAAQLRAHRWAWLQPALLPPAPAKSRDEHQAADDQEEPTQQAAALAQVRRRLELVERGDRVALLREHAMRLDRDRKRAQRGGQPQHAGEEDPEAWARRIVTKIKGGCIRIAARLETGDEHAPQDDDTAAAIEALVAVPPMPGDSAEQQALAARILAKAPSVKLPGRRAVRTRAHLLRQAAEPGPSGWRNALIRGIALDPTGSEVLVRWCRIWAEGRPAAAVAQLWTQAVLVGLAKPSGGVRPIALGETLLKFAEVVLLEITADRTRQTLEPHQVGCRTPGGAEAAIAAIRAAARAPGVAVLQLDQKNAFGMISRREMMEAMIETAPQLARAAACQWQAPVARVAQHPDRARRLAR